jgi:hypothetical protein
MRCGAGPSSTIQGAGLAAQALYGMGAGGSRLEELAAALPEGQRRQHDEFRRDPSAHVLVIADMGTLSPPPANRFGGMEASVDAKAEALLQQGCRVTRLAHGYQDELFLSHRVRWINVGEVAQQGWFRTRSHLVEIARWLALLAQADARAAVCEPSACYAWYDAYGAEAALLGKFLEQQFKLDQADRYLREHFSPILTSGVMAGADLTVCFDGDLQALYRRLGQGAIDAWSGQVGETFSEEKQEEFGRWAEEQLHWRALQSMRFFMNLESANSWGELSATIGSALYQAEVEPGFGPEALFPNVGRTIYTPLARDVVPVAHVDTEGLALDARARGRIQRILISGSDVEERSREARRVARLFPGLGRQFPTMQPVKAIAIGSDDALRAVDALGRDPEEVAAIDYRDLANARGLYARMVTGILSGGGALYAGMRRRSGALAVPAGSGGFMREEEA